MGYPHVTEILRPWADFSRIDPEVLALAANRGSDFHALAATHAQKLWVDEIPNNCVGFFRSFTDWFDCYVSEVVLVEQQLIDKANGFLGTPDAILRIKGDSGLTLIDWKSGQTASKTWVIQVAAYRHLAEKNGYPIARVATLQPRPDGRLAKFTEYTKSLTPALAVFLSALNCWRFFNG